MSSDILLITDILHEYNKKAKNMILESRFYAFLS